MSKPYKYPTTLHEKDNLAFFFYRDKLLKMAFSIFEFKIPDTWDKDFFLENLFTNAPLCVTDSEYGVMPFVGSYSGINVFGKPTNFNVINQALRENIYATIGKDCELIHLGFMHGTFNNINELVERYAIQLAECDASMTSTLVNSRVAQVFSASSTSQLKTAQKLYDNITRGEPAVFLRKTPDEDMQHVIFNNVKQTFIGAELQDFKRGIMNEFLTELGINNSNTDKKERLISDEVNSNNKELNSNIYAMFEDLKTCVNKVNAMFDLGLSVSLNLKVLGGGDNGSESDSVDGPIS